MQLLSCRDELINMIINLRISNQQFLAQIHNTEISAMRSETERDIMFSEVKRNRDLAAMVVKLKVKINYCIMRPTTQNVVFLTGM